VARRTKKMSDYIYEFGVSTNKIGSDTTDVFDLVEDFGYAEEELEGKSESEIRDFLDQDLQDYVWDNIDSWVKRV
jgi:hypothetical protein